LLNIGALKVNKEEPLSFEQIDANLQKMKLKLSIIDQNSDLVNQLSRPMEKAFLKPANRTENIPRPLNHNGNWKECPEVLKEVTKEILITIKDIWNNPAFGPNFVHSLNEGTYVYERQSIASKDRRGEDKMGRRPDIMFEVLHEGKVYELMYGECSRIFCIPKKELDDRTKLWRETNDGLYWTRKGCKPEKEQFGIVGIQIA
ncbi:42363_t:CDS:2, partial [Gigaspora margarita]